MQPFDEFDQNTHNTHSFETPEGFYPGARAPRPRKKSMAREVVLSIVLATGVCVGTLWVLDSGIIRSLSAHESKSSRSRKPEKNWLDWIFGELTKNSRNSYSPYDRDWDPEDYDFEVPEIDFGYDDECYDDDEYYFE